MTKLIITPANVEKYAIISAALRITISKSMIAFNQAAAHKLALKKGDNFQLELEDQKLYFKSSSTPVDSFTVKNETLQKSINAYAKGLLAAMVANKLGDSTDKSIRFDIGDFKHGRWELTPLSK